MDRKEFFELLSKRGGRTGVMTADRWMREVQGCLDGGVCPINFFDDKSPDEWATCLKSAENKLTYTNDRLLIDTKEVDTSARGDGALMRFPCVLTTSSRDRDGDVLETKGADVDENMPLLWQHISIQPVGGFHRRLSHTDDEYRCSWNVADTALGHDVASLIEVGALRMSHGFEPDFERMEVLEDGEGFLFPAFKIFEGSVVSIPANAEAVIEGYERLKFHEPMVEKFCKGFWQSRPVQGVGIDVKPESVDEEPVTKSVDDESDVEAIVETTPQCGCKKEQEEELETKAQTSMPPVIDSVEGSWEWISNKLEASCEDFVKEAGVTDSQYFMAASIVATYPDTAIVCVMNYNRPYSEDECYRCAWELQEGVPMFTGEPAAVEVVAGIRERFTEIVMTKGHIKDIEPGEDDSSVEDSVTKGRDYDACERQLVAAGIHEKTERLQETVETLVEEIKAREPDELALILQAVNQDLVS
jgi:uncharacterized protein